MADGIASGMCAAAFVHPKEVLHSVERMQMSVVVTDLDVLPKSGLPL